MSSFGVSATELTLRWGRYLSIATAALTALSFGLAIIAVPVAGSFCPADCVAYPFSNILAQFPHDYLWMGPAIVLELAFVALAAAIHQAAGADKKVFSLIGLCFATMSSSILVADYFIQISVIQPSLALGETDGIALMTMFNEHGIFIALEDIGYTVMALALGTFAMVLDGRDWRQRITRWLFAAAPILSIIALLGVSVRFGIWRGYIYEVIVISIVWALLLVGSALLSEVFRTARRRPAT